MAQAGVLLTQLITMFLYVGAGWCLCRARLVTTQNNAALTNLLLYVILPCVIVRSFLRPADPETTRSLLWSLLLGALALALSMGVSFLLFRRQPALNFGSAFSNAGFMGIPLITAVLGEGAVFYIAGFVALLNILQWTYGQVLLGAPKKDLRPLALLKNPLVLAFLLGLLLYFLPVELPGILENAVGGGGRLQRPGGHGDLRGAAGEHPGGKDVPLPGGLGRQRRAAVPHPPADPCPAPRVFLSAPGHAHGGVHRRGSPGGLEPGGVRTAPGG